MDSRPSLAVLAALPLSLPIALLSAPASAGDTCAFVYGKPDQVIADCTGFLGRDGADNARKAAALRTRAAAFKEKKDVDRALADLGEGIRLDPNNAELFYDRASLYRFERKDIERAFADIDAAVRLDPNSYPKLSFRGDLDIERNDLAAATADYGEEIRLNPTGVIAYDSRGKVWLMRGDYRRAAEDFDAGFKLSSDYSNVVNDRNRAHATLAAAAALVQAEGMGGPAPDFQADPTRNLYSEARTWRRDGAFHHCTFAFNDDKAALVIGRGRAGYVLALASGEWALSPGVSYPVQVTIGDAPGRQATATVIDAIAIAMPLGADKDLPERLKGYKVPIGILAGQNTIRAPSPDILGFAEKLEACWSKGTATAAAANPFGSPSPSPAAASPAANPFAGAGPVAAAPAPPGPGRDVLAAFLFGAYARWAGGHCEVMTTKRQREAVEARLAALKPEVKEAEAPLVKAVDDGFRCPGAGEPAAELERQIARFPDAAPEAFLAGLPDRQRRELLDALKAALPALAAK